VATAVGRRPVRIESTTAMPTTDTPPTIRADQVKACSAGKNWVSEPPAPVTVAATCRTLST